MSGPLAQSEHHTLLYRTTTMTDPFAHRPYSMEQQQPDQDGVTSRYSFGPNDLATLLNMPTVTNIQQQPAAFENGRLPEAELRKRIREINEDAALEPREKARRIQSLMSGRTTSNKSWIKGAEQEDDGRNRTYHDKSKGILGCKHYQRKVKLQANCCGKIFTCRFCHDEVSDHSIVRQDTKYMFCMLCMTLGPAGQNCSHCGAQVARYYCDKCKLWDDHPEKSSYHCDECGLCRTGRGLGTDFFHCKTCNICMTINMQKRHRCIERSLESDCPICGEYMFTSTTAVTFMPCGHCIHRPCYAAYSKTSYQCPVCFKSIRDMTDYFRLIDRKLAEQPMPAEYKNHVSHIFCNDCEQKSETKYHFFYHKCRYCRSYNTTVLKTQVKQPSYS